MLNVECTLVIFIMFHTILAERFYDYLMLKESVKKWRYNIEIYLHQL